MIYTYINIKYEKKKIEELWVEISTHNLKVLLYLESW